MDSAPFLQTLAEVAVGFAGFSSIVVVFRRRGSNEAWEPQDVFRFRVMLESSLLAGLFAVLPAALAGLGLSDDTLWPVASGLLLICQVFNIVRYWRATRRFLGAGSLSPLLATTILALTGTVIGVQALNIVDWLVPQGAGPYLFGVTWLAAFSGLMFYRLVIIPMTRSS